jgi:hypothetical protein
MQVDHEFILAANYMDIKTLLAANYMDIKVILAANYMDIKAILDVGCKAVANMTKGKPPERDKSTQGWKVGQTTHDDDADSRETTPGIEEWNEQHLPVNLYELQIPLLDVGRKTVANMIKGKPPEEIRKTFNIQNDFTPEEEDQIRRENELVGRRLEERNLLKKKQPGSRDVPVVSFDVGPRNSGCVSMQSPSQIGGTRTPWIWSGNGASHYHRYLPRPYRPLHPGSRRLQPAPPRPGFLRLFRCHQP